MFRFRTSTALDDLINLSKEFGFTVVTTTNHCDCKDTKENDLSDRTNSKDYKKSESTSLSKDKTLKITTTEESWTDENGVSYFLKKSVNEPTNFSKKLEIDKINLLIADAIKEENFSLAQELKTKRDSLK